MKKRTVGELMSPDVVCATPEMTAGEVEALLAKRRVGGAPVVDDEGRVLGVVTLNDIARHAARPMSEADAGRFYTTTDSYRDLADRPTDPAATLVSEFMSKKVFHISREASVAVAASIMRERRVHRLVVMDRSRLVGMISSLDLLRVVEEAV